MKKTLIACLAILCALSNSGFTATYALDAAARGQYKSDGNHATSNYIAGNASSNEYFRNYFVFDLSSIPTTDTVTGASLYIVNPSNGYSSADATETYTNFSLDSTSISALINGNGSNALNVPIYTHLGDGTAYSAGTIVSAASNGTVVQVSLNNSFLAYAQANLGSTVAVGGAITSLDQNDNNNEFIFGSTGFTATAPQLVITSVPEPTCIRLLTLCAIIMTAVWCKRDLTQRCS